MAQNVDPLTGRRTPLLPAAHPVPRQSEFAKGYQAALADVLAAYERGGEAEALQWIETNTTAR